MIIKSCKLGFWKYCVYGKQQSAKATSHTCKGVLDYVHSDIWGPIAVPSNGGAHYFVSFIDDFSGKVWVYFTKHKLEVLPMQPMEGTSEKPYWKKSEVFEI